MACKITTSDLIKTRFLILSDTHGEDLICPGKTLPPADVAIHCGDLTEESKLDEYRASLRLLTRIQAPLKLVIAGNHDFTMDIPTFKDKVASAQQQQQQQQSEQVLEPELVKSTYGDWGEARQLFEEARSSSSSSSGIHFLDEGIHEFTLQNGARLVVYASPYTPSLGDWGFQYPPNHGHDFELPPKGVIDIVMTHGPPRGIMDHTESQQRAGCPHLFQAVARARPRLHCFGHIHEGWGTRLVAWRDQAEQMMTTIKGEETPLLSHFTAIDNSRSTVLTRLSRFKKFLTLGADAADMLDENKDEEEDDEDDHQSRRERSYWEQGYYPTRHCTGDAHPIVPGLQTLFVNAAIQDSSEEWPLQLPWLVDIELSKAA